MSEEELLPVTVRILDKEYCVACQPHEQEDLLESARLLDQRMRTIRQKGNVIGSDRIAVQVALNISHELLVLQRQQRLEREMADRLAALQEQVQEALATQQALDAPEKSV